MGRRLARYPVSERHGEDLRHPWRGGVVRSSCWRERKANCNSCHLDGRGTGADTSAAADVAPPFTCFGYANLGLPLNPRVAIYYQTTPDPFGFTPNPFGFAFRDLGLGNFLRSVAAPNP